MRVRVASPHMIGKALQWHINYIRNNFGIFPPWLDYTIAIFAQFGDDDALPMYRAPFNHFQNHNDPCHYKREFGNYNGPEIELNKESDEIEDEELQDKQPEGGVFGVVVETFLMNEDEQPLECDDDESFDVGKSSEVTVKEIVDDSMEKPLIISTNPEKESWPEASSQTETCPSLQVLNSDSEQTRNKEDGIEKAAMMWGNSPSKDRNILELVLERFWLSHSPKTTNEISKSFDKRSFAEKIEDTARRIRYFESRLGYVTNFLAEFCVYEVFHLQRPPEISIKASPPNTFNFILEDKDALRRGVLQ